MTYGVPIMRDDSGNTLGFYVVYTNVGQSLLIADPGPRVDELLQMIALTLEEGQELAWMDLRASSFDAAVQQLMDVQPDLKENFDLFEDSDPLFDDIVDYYRKQM